MAFKKKAMAGEMTQSIKYTLHKSRDLSLNSQNLCNGNMPFCNPRTPTRSRTGDSQEACWLPSLEYTAIKPPNNQTIEQNMTGDTNKIEDEDWHPRMSFDVHSCTILCPCLHSHTRTSTKLYAYLSRCCVHACIHTQDKNEANRLILCLQSQYRLLTTSQSNLQTPTHC